MTKRHDVVTATSGSFQATCSTCSYVGRRFDRRADAENDGDEHEIAVGDNRLHHRTRVTPESTS